MWKDILWAKGDSGPPLILYPPYNIDTNYMTNSPLTVCICNFYKILRYAFKVELIKASKSFR